MFAGNADEVKLGLGRRENLTQRRGGHRGGTEKIGRSPHAKSAYWGPGAEERRKKAA